MGIYENADVVENNLKNACINQNIAVSLWYRKGDNPIVINL